MKAKRSKDEIFQKHFILLTLGLVVLVGAFSVQQILTPPQRTMKSLVANVREPASVNMIEAPAYKDDLTKATSINVECGSDVDLGNLSVAHLRMKSLYCNEGETIEIQNLSNGFTASLIDLKEGRFTSDFIDLSDGVNEIEISRKSAGRSDVRQKVKVTRLPAQANEKL